MTPGSAPTIRDGVILACEELQRLGLLFSTYGNVSVRSDNGFWVTPSRVPYDTLGVDDLVCVSLDGRHVTGQRLPSSEAEIHRRIYADRPEIRAIVHTHAVTSMAVSTLQTGVPTIVEEQAQVLGGPIPCASYVPAGQHVDLAKGVVDALDETQAVLLANHGAVAFGRSLEEAIEAALVVERVCDIWLRTIGLSEGPRNLPPAAIRSERDRWLHHYGRESDGTLDADSAVRS